MMTVIVMMPPIPVFLLVLIQFILPVAKYRVIIIFNVRLVGIKLKELDIDQPLFLAIAHEAGVLVIIPHRTTGSIHSLMMMLVVIPLIISIMIVIVVVIVIVVGVLVVLEKRLVTTAGRLRRWRRLFVGMERSIVLNCSLVSLMRRVLRVVVHLVVRKWWHHRMIGTHELRRR